MFKDMKKQIKPLKMQLQFFAEEDPDPKDPPADLPKEPTDLKGGEPTKVELTEEELQKKIESESDRKLQRALQKKEQEWETKTQEAIKQALAEEKRLSKLSEKEQEEERMTKREKELQDRENELKRKELKAEAITDLSNKELPTEFADFLLAEDAEKTLENINSFKKAFDAAVNKAVKEKLRQETPDSGVGTSKGTNTIAEIRNKKDKEQNKAPDLWA
ncbi:MULTISPECIES: DUF4355 domain-containing protein [Clostridia]|uniref:DUF4355 domain-containing protein n=1 Tax=Clostridia TaxID=186801 RepID=UPI000EA3BEFC|nr:MULTISPECIES: DUF4355 domain-containing protein [Clostridia]NBJ71336.1 DUF4355 domain-containing protein [Roseburia sp. 1XD42-34]RKI74407.1 DUF4355 domain-containing protein [Clostridium sp. 1xD42-85]